jgi:hypothetical protein
MTSLGEAFCSPYTGSEGMRGPPTAQTRRKPLSKIWSGVAFE